MRSVGLRELKARLSHYVRQVRAGKRVLVSDRGEIVAELAPPGAASDSAERVPASLAALARRGHVRLAARGDRAPLPALPRALRRTTSAALLDAERGST